MKTMTVGKGSFAPYIAAEPIPYTGTKYDSIDVSLKTAIGCEWCKGREPFLSGTDYEMGEDWFVLINGNRLVYMIGTVVHDYKVIKLCPICGGKLNG